MNISGLFCFIWVHTDGCRYFRYCHYSCFEEDFVNKYLRRSIYHIHRIRYARICFICMNFVLAWWMILIQVNNAFHNRVEVNLYNLKSGLCIMCVSTEQKKKKLCVCVCACTLFLHRYHRFTLNTYHWRHHTCTQQIDFDSLNWMIYLHSDTSHLNVVNELFTCAASKYKSSPVNFYGFLILAIVQFGNFWMGKAQISWS